MNLFAPLRKTLFPDRRPLPPGLEVMDQHQAPVGKPGIGERAAGAVEPLIFTRDLVIVSAPDGRPTSLDEKNRTVDAVVMTEGAVDTNRPYPDGYSGPARETLLMSGFDCSRGTGAPLLLDHLRTSGAQIGVVDGVRIGNGQAVATLRFSSSPTAEPFWQDIVAGIRRNVSAGYRVLDFTRQVGADGVPEYTITRSQLLEVSIVTIPADPTTGIRGADAGSSACGAQGGYRGPVFDRVLADDRARTEAERLSGVASREYPGVFPPDYGTRIFDDTAAIQNPEERLLAMRSHVIDHIAANSAGNRIAALPSMSQHGMNPSGRTFDNPVFVRSAMEAALAARLCPAVRVGSDDPAREFMGQRMLDLAVRTMEMANIDCRRMRPDEVFERALTASDFPSLLLASGNRAFLGFYQIAKSPLTKVARVCEATDYRDRTVIRLSGSASLEEIAENGEVTHGAHTEGANSYSVKDYGRIIAWTRKAMMNDDLGAIGQTFGVAGNAAASREASLLVGLLSANGWNGVVMKEDGKTLFHADHQNLAVPSMPAVASLGEMRALMRLQKGLADDDYLAIVPRYLIVGPMLETSGERLLSSIYANTVADANPFSGRLELLVEPRIPDNRWFIAADPALGLAPLEIAYLGQPGPQVVMEQGFDVLGVKFRTTMTCGAGAVEWRAIAQNVGTP